MVRDGHAIVAAVRQQLGDHGADLAAADEKHVFHAATLEADPDNSSRRRSLGDSPRSP